MSRRTAISRLLVVVGASAAVLASGMPSNATTHRDGHQRTRPVLSHASAKRFFLESVEEKVRGDWSRAWQSLYPLHRRIASRETFVRCETRTPFPAPLQSLHVVDVRDAAVRVPGVRQPVPGVAVEVVVELEWYGPRDPMVFRHTFHLVQVQRHWTWLLSPSRYRLYERHACPADDQRVETADRGRAPSPRVPASTADGSLRAPGS